VIRRLESSEFADQLDLLNDQVENSNSLLADFSQWILGIFGSSTSSESEITFEDIVEDLRGRISIKPIRETDMIEIKVSASSPEEAAFICNTLSNSYSERNRLNSQEEVRQVKNFLDNQLSAIQDQLIESENALKAFKQFNKVVALPQETEELIKKLAEFEGQYNEALTEYNAHQQRLVYIDQQLDRRGILTCKIFRRSLILRA